MARNASSGWLALICAVLVVSAARAGETLLFEEGFEGATTCGWSLAVDGNDEVANATELTGSPDDCENGGTAGGDLHAGDTDYLTYHFVDAPFCAAEPTISVSSDHAATSCLFVECDEGTTEITCPDGTIDAALGAAPGCCAAAATSVAISISDFDCDGSIDDSARVWIMLQSASSACTRYAVAYDD